MSHPSVPLTYAFSFLLELYLNTIFMRYSTMMIYTASAILSDDRFITMILKCTREQRDDIFKFFIIEKTQILINKGGSRFASLYDAKFDNQHIEILAIPKSSMESIHKYMKSYTDNVKIKKAFTRLLSNTSLDRERLSKFKFMINTLTIEYVKYRHTLLNNMRDGEYFIIIRPILQSYSKILFNIISNYKQRTYQSIFVAREYYSGNEVDL